MNKKLTTKDLIEMLENYEIDHDEWDREDREFDLIGRRYMYRRETEENLFLTGSGARAVYGSDGWAPLEEDEYNW